jgi:hypothetical protein
LGVKILPIFGKIALKAVTAVTLNVIDKSDIEALKTIKDDVATGISDAAEKMIEERLNAQTKDIDLVETFKKKLGELAKKISEQGNGKLVIIIDELDRCRPSFAVEILEKIKHFFSVPNVFFVLVMHKQQLECAVKHIYGDRIDAHTYLQKFIHVETTLPKRNDISRSNIKTYIEQLSFQQGFLGKKYHYGRTESQFFIDNLYLFAQHFKLSLRELEKVFTNLVIIHTGIENVKDTKANIFLAIFVSVVKVKHPEILNRLQLKNISYEELNEELKKLDKQLNISAINFGEHHEKLAFIIKDMLSIKTSSERHYGTDNPSLLSKSIEALSLFKIS